MLENDLIKIFFNSSLLYDIEIKVDFMHYLILQVFFNKKKKEVTNCYYLEYTKGVIDKYSTSWIIII